MGLLASLRVPASSSLLVPLYLEKKPGDYTSQDFIHTDDRYLRSDGTR